MSYKDDNGRKPNVYELFFILIMGAAIVACVFALWGFFGVIPQ
jgi:hypothetical protein